MYKKYLISIPLLAGAILWLLVGCSGESATKYPPGSLSYRMYSDDYDDFTIRFPQSWSLVEDEDGLEVNATAPLDEPSPIRSSHGWSHCHPDGRIPLIGRFPFPQYRRTRRYL